MFSGVDRLDSIPENDHLLYGVNEPAQIETAGQYYDRSVADITLFGVTYRIRRHPELLMLPHIDEWITDYKYTNKYKVPVPFESRHPCWIDLENEYEYIQKGMNNGKR